MIRGNPCRAAVVAITLAIISHGYAQIRTDGSMHPQGATHQFSGVGSAIPASIGTQKGGNLFHSFERFDIPTNGRATFQGPSSVTNVLARVTGGSASQINGALACDIAGANVYLMNPAGVVFGPGAMLDVTGSFSATTADHIDFADSARLPASLSSPATLTTAPPAAFGFLQSAKGRIDLTDSTLSVGPRSLRLIASDVRIAGGELRAGGIGNTGAIVIAGVGAGVSAALAPDGFIPDATPALGGTVTLKPSVSGRRSSVTLIGATEDFTTPDSEQRVGVRVSGGDVLLDRTTISLGDFNTELPIAFHRSAVAIDAAETLALSRSVVEVNARYGGAAGEFTGKHVDIRGSSIESFGDLTEVGAFVAINADRGVTVTRTLIDAGDSTSEFFAGDISLRSRRGDIRLGDRTQVYGEISLRAPQGSISAADSTLSSSGFGGSLEVAAGRTIDFTNTTSHLGAVEMVAGESIRLSGGVFDQSVGASRGESTPGHMSLEAREVYLTDGTTADFSSSADVSDSGDLALRVRASLLSFESGTVITAGDPPEQGDDDDPNDEQAPSIDLVAKTIQLSDGATIDSSTASGRDAGAMRLRADDVRLTRGAQLRSSTTGRGAGGLISIDATGELALDRGSVIESSSEGVGDAGQIQLAAKSLLIREGSQVRTSASAASLGAAGSITIRADSVRLIGTLEGDTPTGIFANADSSIEVRPSLVVEVDASFVDEVRIRSPRGEEETVYLGYTVFDTDPDAFEENYIDTHLSFNRTRFDNSSDIQDLPFVPEQPFFAEIGAGRYRSSVETALTRGFTRGTWRVRVSNSAGAFLETNARTPVGRSVAIEIGGERFEAAGVTPYQRVSDGFVIESGVEYRFRVPTNARLDLGEAVRASRTPFVRIDAGVVQLDRAVVSSTTSGIRNAGAVRVNADSVSLSDSKIATDSAGRGAGGNIALSANGAVDVTGSEIIASASGRGPAGSILAVGDVLSIRSSVLQSASGAASDAGRIELVGASSFLQSDRSSVSVAAQSGKAGNVVISGSGVLTIDGGSEVSANTLGQGGNIDLNAGSGSILIRDARVTAEAGSEANIKLTAADTVLVSNSTISARTTGNGGAISIDPRFVILNNSTIDGQFGANATPVQVAIDPTSTFLLSTDSQILADQPSLPPQIDVAGALVTFSVVIDQSQLQFVPDCFALMNPNVQASSFSVQGREGVIGGATLAPEPTTSRR